MSFWQAEKVDDRFSYRVVQDACVGPDENYQFYMGGAAMATHVNALERYFEKPLLWATTQFLSHGMLANDLTLDVKQIGGGKNVVQAEAVMRRGDEVLHRTIAALGARGDDPDRAFVTMPVVKNPEACPHKPEDAMASEQNLIGRFDRRTAFEDNDTGTEYMWIRGRDRMKIDAAYLALISDFFLGARMSARDEEQVSTIHSDLSAPGKRIGYCRSRKYRASREGGPWHGAYVCRGRRIAGHLQSDRNVAQARIIEHPTIGIEMMDNA